MRYGGKDVRESKEGCGKVGGEVCEEELPKARMQNRTAEETKESGTRKRQGSGQGI